jgi:hypothetical protein
VALALAIFSVPSQADVSCALSMAAGKSSPAPASPGNPRGFRIFWHVATQIEDIADAGTDQASMADIRAASKLVDGYYFNVLLGGPLIYWPGRPRQCALNFKRITANETLDLDGTELTFPEGGQAGRDSCRKQQDQFLARQDKARDTPAELQFDALRRAAKVLDLKDARARGLPIWGEIIVRNSDFSYDSAADKVHLNDLPATYCGLANAGFTLDGMMIYQEPAIQQKQGNYLAIPRRNRAGKLIDSGNARASKIPENTHAFRLLADAFAEARIPPGALRPNIRRWNAKRSPPMIRELDAIPQVGGYNFEGGTRIAADQRIDNFVEGMSWILANSDRDISLLMPGYWPRDMIGSDAEIDGLIGRVRSTILSLNTKLSQKMGLKPGQNAICTNRVIFIPASYGQPVHVRTLPMTRNGHLAGTVTGQIRLLADIRRELCGV